MTSSSSSSLSQHQPSRPSFFRSISSSSSVHNFSHELFPRKGKPRLYLALFPRGGSKLTSSYKSAMTCDSYHWTLLIGPESPAREGAGTYYHITHEDSGSAAKSIHPNSVYEENNLSEHSKAHKDALLVRIAIAKVIDEARLIKLIRTLPHAHTQPSKRKWQRRHLDDECESEETHVTSTCLTWVKQAYELLTSDGKSLRGYVGAEDWPEIEEVVRMYAKRKRRQGRFGDQRGADRTWNPDEIPTWNFWENRETTD